MADDTTKASESVVDELHWGVVLRSDIQDLRQETRADIQNLRQDTRDLRQETAQEFAAVRQEMAQGFASVRQEMDGMRQSNEAFRAEVNDRFDRAQARADTRFYWTIGIIVTLFGVQNGIMVALFRI